MDGEDSQRRSQVGKEVGQMTDPLSKTLVFQQRDANADTLMLDQ